MKFRIENGGKIYAQDHYWFSQRAKVKNGKFKRLYIIPRWEKNGLISSKMLKVT